MADDVDNDDDDFWNMMKTKAFCTFRVKQMFFDILIFINIFFQFSFSGL